MNGLDLGQPSIQVITEDQKNILDIIDKITDPETKMKFLELCYATHSTPPEPKPTVENYHLKEVINMIHSSVVEKPVTIQDLRFEINSLKKEIQQLKACNHIIFKEIKDLKE